MVVRGSLPKSTICIELGKDSGSCELRKGLVNIGKRVNFSQHALFERFKSTQI